MPGQVRGVSWLAPILQLLRDLDEASDAQLLRQKIAAMLAGFVTTQDGGAAAFTGEQSGQELTASLEPGTLQALNPGEDVTFSEPARIGSESIEFLKMIARQVAAGLSIPYELLTTDLREVNYSSARVGLIEFRRKVEAIQHHVIAFQMLRPIWRRWVTVEVLAGRLDLPGFESDPEPFLAANWITPRQVWVDPQKDAEAEVNAINAGLMSRREAVAARGLDIEALDAEIAADKAREKELGLDFSGTTAKQKEPINE